MTSDAAGHVWITSHLGLMFDAAGAWEALFPGPRKRGPSAARSQVRIARISMCSSDKGVSPQNADPGCTGPSPVTAGVDAPGIAVASPANG